MNTQEGAAKISVFGQATRTSAAVEAYNGYLNKKIQSHPQFFALINILREEEFSKSRDFDLLFKSADPPVQRQFHRQRDDKIKKMSNLLKAGKISTDHFLNGIAFEGNRLFDDRCAFSADMVTNLYGSDDEMDVDIEVEPIQEVVSGVISGGTCNVCYAKPSDVMLSCGHYKHCLECFEKLKSLHDENVYAFRLGRIEFEPKFKCPHCNTEIVGHLHVPKIFH